MKGNMITYLHGRSMKSSRIEANIRYVLAEKKLTVAKFDAEKLFQYDMVCSLTQYVSQCSNTLGYVIPEVYQSVFDLRRQIPTDGQLKEAQRCLSRGIFFRPALLTQSGAEKIKAELSKLRTVCDAYLSKASPIHVLRQEHCDESAAGLDDNAIKGTLC